MDTAYVELHAGGKITKNVGVTLNLNGNISSFGNSKLAVATGADAQTAVGSFVAVEDAIISFDFIDEFHLWAGHLLVPVDRTNASGPFFMIPWNFPGAPRASRRRKKDPRAATTEPSSGATSQGGKLTYLAGVFDNGNVASSPFFTGRLRLALLGRRAGILGNASYFGDKDMFSFGVGGQFQKHGSSAGGVDKDWTDLNGDVLIRKEAPRRQLRHRRGGLLSLRRPRQRGQRFVLRARGLR